MDGIRIEQRLWQGQKVLERMHMPGVEGGTGVLERRNCLASRSEMHLSFQIPVVTEGLYE